MRETEMVVSAYEQAKQQSAFCILATVVHVEGSSYRRAGARMLVGENGQMTGAISGGCLEGDALRKALLALHHDENKLVLYDTSDENDAVIGVQLGCNGLINVLFEPIHFDNPQNPVELLKRAIANKRSVLVSLFNLDRKMPQVGTAMLIGKEFGLTGDMGNRSIRDQVLVDAKGVLENGQSLFREYRIGDEHQYAFLEYMAQPMHLVLVGAGNDARVLSELARVLGWRVSVVDGRPTHANTDRFHASCQVIAANPEAALAEISVDERTAIVLMTHNYQYDLSMLKLLIEWDLPYIGILGPKKKFQRMLDELKKSGIEITKGHLEKVYAPVGLEIGAETPEEIGLSITAEIQAVMSGTSGSFLRDKKGPIHKDKNSGFKTVIIE